MSWFNFFNRPKLSPVVAAPVVIRSPPDRIKTTDLSAIGVTQENRDKYLPHLNNAAREFDIVTKNRASMFVAQVAHESGLFRYTSEIWGPTPAQSRYEGRADLGNVYPGDGSQYRGHGFIQVTGRTNHAKVASYFHVPFEQIVSWLQTPEGACRSAGWYWMAHGCNELADSLNIEGVTRAINGGVNGLQQRLDLWNKIYATMS